MSAHRRRTAAGGIHGRLALAEISVVSDLSDAEPMECNSSITLIGVAIGLGISAALSSILRQVRGPLWEIRFKVMVES